MQERTTPRKHMPKELYRGVKITPVSSERSVRLNIGLFIFFGQLVGPTDELWPHTLLRQLTNIQQRCKL
jgi:hypothetical protein